MPPLELLPKSIISTDDSFSSFKVMMNLRGKGVSSDSSTGIVCNSLKHGIENTETFQHELVKKIKLSQDEAHGSGIKKRLSPFMKTGFMPRQGITAQKNISITKSLVTSSVSRSTTKFTVRPGDSKHNVTPSRNICSDSSQSLNTKCVAPSNVRKCVGSLFKLMSTASKSNNSSSNGKLLLTRSSANSKSSETYVPSNSHMSVEPGGETSNDVLMSSNSNSTVVPTANNASNVNKCISTNKCADSLDSSKCTESIPSNTKLLLASDSIKSLDVSIPCSSKFTVESGVSSEVSLLLNSMLTMICANNTNLCEDNKSSDASNDSKSVDVSVIPISILAPTSAANKCTNTHISSDGKVTLTPDSVKSSNVSVAPNSNLEFTTENEADYGDNNLAKVVVQAIPALDFGRISALQQCISDTRISQNSSNNNALCMDFLFEKKQVKKPVDHSFRKSVQEIKSPSPKVTSHGVKLADISYIKEQVENGSSPSLRILHYILFGRYGSVGTESLLFETRKNILQFNGYPFEPYCDECLRKKMCLERIPFPILVSICDLLIGNQPPVRFNIIEDLMDFLLKPSVQLFKMLNSSVYSWYSTAEIARITEIALRGPTPTVLIERLDGSYIKKVNKTVTKKKSTYRKKRMLAKSSHGYTKPEYVFRGPGLKLKYLPEVKSKIRSCNKRTINLLHCILYGRPGCDTSSRFNILEFCGFPPNKTDFARTSVFIKRLQETDIVQILDLFSLPVNTSDTACKVQKLLSFLQEPTAMNKRKKRVPRTHLTKPAKSEKANSSKDEIKTELITSPDSNLRNCENNEINTDLTSTPVVKLRDFENICFNVECATPEDLAELNDLLFIKPCDNTEIHQKILEFTPFTFDEHSLEFNYRRTLLHYMDTDIIKKIARVLDIPGFEDFTNQQDLASTTLKFLMEMKKSDKSQVKKKSRNTLVQKIDAPVSVTSTSRPYVLKFQQNPESPQKQSNSCDLQNTDEDLRSSFTTDMTDPLFPVLEICQSSVEENSVFTQSCSGGSTYSLNSFQNAVRRSSESDTCDSALSDFMNHPTKEELIIIIRDIIATNIWSITVRQVVDKVFSCYTHLNLNYRTDFIQTQTLEVLQELRKNAINSAVCEMSF